MEATAIDASLPAEVGEQLKRAQKKIADLHEDIGRLSDELLRKDSLLATFKSRLPALSSWLESTLTGELPQHSTAAALREAQRDPWSGVAVHSQKKAPGGTPCGVSSSVSIPLSNKYLALSMSAEPLVKGPADPEAFPKDVAPPLSDNTAFPPLVAACAPADQHPAQCHPAQCRPAPCHSPPSLNQAEAEAAPQGRCVMARPHQAPDRKDRSTEQATPLRQQATTLVIGDSIIRNVHLRGAFTLSFPGTTVADVTEKILSVLNSHPQINRVVIHVGTNDTYRQQSELLKRDFTQLFNKLSQPQLRVFISGPTPTCGRGIGHFNRLLSLNTWLSSACSTYNVCFVNNLDVFWERRHLFGSDGLHLNRAGIHMLAPT
ncbi:unnamed protein product [Xyrichtys novacula]|uniref:Unnamed protein product n=1 Tax=Xyrichtys novacula TaxID=13765 RepID=A0AAV1FH04_XYRNO|nr:unnamed protein product [Xyrichtys novacula]